jgi:hypothetical protein
MPVTIIEDSFFKQGYEIKYVTPYDNIFKTNTQQLKFYPGTSLYTVNVDISASSDLQEEDITVTYGKYHNANDIIKKIRDNEKTIYEMCKSSRLIEFVLDLSTMKVVEREDFIGFLPRFGLNTFFIFDDIGFSKFYCLVNATPDIKDGEYYSWFISYIYSNAVCVIPNKVITNYSKMFFQALSLLASNSGNKNNIKLVKNKSILNCTLSDCGYELLEVPSENTTRFEKLVLSSMNQMTKHKSKK